MANVKRLDPNPGPYENRKYLTLKEAEDYLGIKHSTLYSNIRTLGIEPHKFVMDKKLYLSLEEVKQIKSIREEPWLAGERKRRDQEVNPDKEPSLV